MNNQNIEQIEQYLDGTLSGKERQQMEERLGSDSDLKATLQWHLDLRQVAIAAEEVRLIQMLKNTSTKQAKIVRLPYKVYALAAAILLLLIAGIWWLIPQPDNDLFATHFQPYPNVTVPLERDELNDNLEIRAFRAYEEADYPLAAARLDSLLQAEPKMEYRFYLAMAQLVNSDYISSIENLETVREMGDAAFGEYAMWYLGLAYWKVGDKNQSTILFKNMAADAGHPFSQKAQDVLEEFSIAPN